MELRVEPRPFQSLLEEVSLGLMLTFLSWLYYLSTEYLQPHPIF